MIRFSSHRESYGWLSNFCYISLWIDGKQYLSTEHYYQSQKFAGTPLEEQIRLAPSPAKAKELGSTRSVPLRPDWEEVKEQVMWYALWHKFTQHQMMRDALLNTGDHELVEDRPDEYWGIGNHGTGLNRLGVMLVALRNQLKAAV